MSVVLAVLLAVAVVAGSVALGLTLGELALRWHSRRMPELPHVPPLDRKVKP